ncbi:hypothetical protein ACIQAL_25260 [Pseudomonas sp. NPDC088368]|uniref:hypothetical protein n=1 Tax=Pseudomonas sp. NPDC088368 TaxID=3364453 RepID=UPI003810400D
MSAWLAELFGSRNQNNMEIIIMTAIKLDLNASVQPEARFEGEISAEDPYSYEFSGKLVARAPLSKPDSIFVVRLGHGGNTGAYSYLEYTFKGAGDNTFSVEGSGKRKKDEKVDFRLGFKEGSEGQFSDGDKSTYTLDIFNEDRMDISKIKTTNDMEAGYSVSGYPKKEY